MVNYLNIIHIFFQKIDIATAQERDEFEATPDVPAAPNDDDDLDPDDDDDANVFATVDERRLQELDTDDDNDFVQLRRKSPRNRRRTGRLSIIQQGSFYMV